MCNGIDDGISDGVTETNYIKKRQFPSWFGKGCHFFAGVWEENEFVNPDFKEYEPVLNHCSHHLNYSETEGNCVSEKCPIDYKSK